MDNSDRAYQEEKDELAVKLEIASRKGLEYQGLDDEGEPEFLGTKEQFIAYEEELETFEMFEGTWDALNKLTIKK